MRSKTIPKSGYVIQRQRLTAKNIENRKVSKTRRQRGYQWEDTLVKRFNALDSWKAFRLGSPSVHYQTYYVLIITKVRSLQLRQNQVLVHH